ncbi:MAG: phosphoribosylamine--glycine ligase [Acidimicrobiales bacterium]
MRVVVVGSGGREHALAAVLGRGADVVVTPGNAGIPGSTDTPPEQLDADLYVIGPEAPLVDGLADRLRGAGRRVYGPGGDGARLEGSKAWMKQLVAEARVPTARYGAFDAGQLEPALAFLGTLPPPFVVKTDGLAAGKGVLVTDSQREAEDDVRSKLSGTSFGDAGRTVVIEEGLTGQELSILAVCDGTRAVPLAPAQDFKRLRDGDDGPNTGGMGAYSPVPFAAEDLVGAVMDRFIEPTLFKLTKEGIDYRGTLYAGLMLTAEGPKLLEYNVRFGDPEAQVVLPRLDRETDLADLLAQAADGHLWSDPRFVADAAVAVVVASPGYPEAPQMGAVIEGLDRLETDPSAQVFYAGVASNDAGELVTAGGRVCAIVGHGPDLTTARTNAYAAVDHISFDGMQFREDIAKEVTTP